MSADHEEDRLADATEQANLAKAFQAVAQGEQQAAQMEKNLSSLESKIDELLKQAEENQKVSEASKQDQGAKPMLPNSDTSKSK